MGLKGPLLAYHNAGLDRRNSQCGPNGRHPLAASRMLSDGQDRALGGWGPSVDVQLEVVSRRRIGE